jgi:hypothetical protein
MPWKIRKTKSGGANLVNKITGKVKSHHASPAKAKAALRAIYANWKPSGAEAERIHIRNSDIRPRK